MYPNWRSVDRARFLHATRQHRNERLLHRELGARHLSRARRVLRETSAERRDADELEAAALDLLAESEEEDFKPFSSSPFDPLDDDSDGEWAERLLVIADHERGGPVAVYLEPLRRVRLPQSVVVKTALQYEEMGHDWQALGLSSSAEFMELALATKLALTLDCKSPGVQIRTEDRHTYYGVPMLLCYLSRMREQQSHQADVGRIFDYATSDVSRVFKETGKHIKEQLGDLVDIENLHRFSAFCPAWNQAIKSRFVKAMYGDNPPGAVHYPPEIEYSAAIVDGYFQRTKRPTDDLADLQRYMFSGFQKAHGSLYCVVLAPNGIIVGLGGPFPGCNTDASAANLVDLEGNLAQWTLPHSQQRWKLLCDAIYAPSPCLAPFSFEHSTYPKAKKDAVRTCRTPVEHALAVLTQMFPYLTSKRKHDVRTASGLHMQCAAILCNLITCIRGGNQINTSFPLAPFTLLEYLSVRV